MRKLDRTVASTPTCLQNYNHRIHNWGDLKLQDKQMIEAEIKKMQGKLCVYCECDMSEAGKHIEHFAPRARFASRTFDWTNLFWSCSKEISCGHYKDRNFSSYDPNQIVNPNLHDPDSFFKFYSDGHIEVKDGLSPSDEARAVRTVQILGIDPLSGGALREARKTAVAPYLRRVKDAIQSGMSKQDFQSFLSGELTQCKNMPYGTAIRHVLQT